MQRPFDPPAHAAPPAAAQTDGGRTFTEPSAIISGVVEGQEEVRLARAAAALVPPRRHTPADPPLPLPAWQVIVRVHDACFTSEVLGSLKCDCRDQLALALDVIQAAPPGMVIYLQQEGRGIGLANKIAAYALQEKGLDTVDANRALGLPDDCREYSAVRAILHDLGVKSIRLMVSDVAGWRGPLVCGVQQMQRPDAVCNVGRGSTGVLGAVCLGSGHGPDRLTPPASSRRPALPCLAAQTNNPRKIAEISALGITVTERVPCIVKTQQYNRGYLAAKQARMEHILSDEELDGQFCFWEHAGEPGPTGIPLEPVAPLLDADEALAAAEAAAAQQQQHRGGGGGGAL
jgi:GTP cyclohydrolase II